VGDRGGLAAGGRARPVGHPGQALLHGLAMQQRVDPGSVSDETAVAGLAALLGLDTRPPSPLPTPQGNDTRQESPS